MFFLKELPTEAMLDNYAKKLSDTDKTNIMQALLETTHDLRKTQLSVGRTLAPNDAGEPYAIWSCGLSRPLV